MNVLFRLRFWLAAGASITKQQVDKIVIEPARLLRFCRLRTVACVLEQTTSLPSLLLARNIAKDFGIF